MKRFTVILTVIAVLLVAGCAKPVDTNTEASIVTIKGYQKEPASMSSKNSIILKGLSEGEFVEVLVSGEIQNFEHIRLEWDAEKNELVEKEVLSRFDKLTDQAVIIKTYMPEGIPSEKLKWQSLSGKSYEFVIQANGKDGNGLWEFDME